MFFSFSGEQGWTPLGDAQPPLTQERVTKVPLIGMGCLNVSVRKDPLHFSSKIMEETVVHVF
jgi:hypothetical protein